MKNIFTIVFFLLILLSAQARSKDPGLDQLRAQATMQARDLAQKIGLNELEYIKIRDYTLQKLVAIEEANELYAQDEGLRAERLAAIEELFIQQLLATLTPKQYMNYITLNIPR